MDAFPPWKNRMRLSMRGNIHARRCSVWVLLVCLECLMHFGGNAYAQGGAAFENSDPAPKLSYKETIHLWEEGLFSTVMQLAFSPDGKYLAIVDVASPGNTDVIIWNLSEDKKQSLISIKGTFFGEDPTDILQWAPNGEYVTFTYGDGTDNRPMVCWNPETGEVEKKIPILSGGARFNISGSEMAVPLGRTLRVYDTRSWAYKDFQDDHYRIDSIVWISKDRLLMIGAWRSKGLGARQETAEEHKFSTEGIPLRSGEFVARIFDASGGKIIRTTALFPSHSRSGSVEADPTASLVPYYPRFLVSSYKEPKVALGVGGILDAMTLDVFTYATFEDIRSRKFPITSNDDQNVAMSPDGKYIFLKGEAKDNDSANNVIVDAYTGKILLLFKGGQCGIAVSPDNRILAAGWGKNVEMFNLQ